MKRSAFTMLELIFVIIVIGILAAAVLPRMERDLKQEAADNILSAIRYTQHLALADNRHSSNDPRWQRRFWRIMFAQCADGTYFYRIGNDDDMSGGGFTQAEAALDPINGKVMFVANNGNCNNANISENILIGRKYGVVVNQGAGGCPGLRHIGFDHLGRPHVNFANSNTPDYGTYMPQVCTLNFTVDGQQLQITIQPETGYAQIVGQNDS